MASRDQITSLAARYAIPTMFADRASAAAGGLLSYGANFPDVNHQVGVYAGRMLNSIVPQALEILGLKARATDDEIRAAYIRLMQRVHPDKGGTDFFAKQLIDAREVLLRQRAH